MFNKDSQKVYSSLPLHTHQTWLVLPETIPLPGGSLITRSGDGGYGAKGFRPEVTPVLLLNQVTCMETGKYNPTFCPKEKQKYWSTAPLKATESLRNQTVKVSMTPKVQEMLG